MSEVSLLVAFAAGGLSFLSPCVLPIVPAYIGRLATLADGEPPLVHAGLFTAGFGILFTLLGVGAAYAGGSLGALLPVVQLPLGVAIAIGGLHLSGVVHLSLLNRVSGPLPVAARGRLGSLLLGAAFAAAWTPCIGIVLGAILALAATGSNTLGATALLAAYSAGLGLPFILIAAVAGRQVERGDRVMRKLRRGTRLAGQIGGLLVTVIGLLIATGTLPALARLLPGLPGL